MLDANSGSDKPRPMYKIVGGDRREYGPVSGDQIRQWVTEGRANGDTLVQSEGGVWQKLSTYPEFAEALRAPTGAIPPPFTVQPEYLSTTDEPRQRVQGPAIAMIALGIVCLCTGALGLISHSFGMAVMPLEIPDNPELERLMEFFAGGVGVAAYLIELVLSALILLGGLRMLHLKNYGLCVAAAIIALVPCTSPCCCLGLPIGIWALVVLTKAEVKTAFS